MKSKKKSKTKKKEDKLNLRQINKLRKELFYANPAKNYNYKQVAKILNLRTKKVKKLIIKSLALNTKSGFLEETHRGKYRLKQEKQYLTGKVSVTARGAGYFITAEDEKDIFIPQENMGQALNNDIVKIRIIERRKKEQPVGKIVEIVERAKKQYVGTIELKQKYAFLISDDRFMPFDLHIQIEDLKGAKNGQKVVAEIKSWSSGSKNPNGIVTKVLGYAGEHETEIHAIMEDFELPYEFPEAVKDEAEKIDAQISKEEIKKRRDFRNITTFTIDPEDAKDFDDALSVKKLENGNWEIGIHIADVTHYVTPNSIIEKEATKRATSVYLVDRVVPMLPERLSNFVCSLRPEEEKLTFSAVFEMNEEAKVLNKWFGRTIICSNRRFTYNDAQQIIETKEGDYAEELLKLNELAQKLRNKRFAGGAIDFDRSEMKFRLNEKKEPIEVYFKYSLDANKLIEEFMLLANKKVAEEIGKYNGGEIKTFVYRIHDKPDEEKINNFSRFIKRFGYEIDNEHQKKIAKSINKLMQNIKGKKECNIIQQLAIRSMAKAVYSTQNIGHYGLSFSFYTHFTSPIRRYPDMIVHRLLERYAKEKKSANKELYEDYCKHSSEMEQKAVMAERASIKYKQVEFMKKRLGDEFYATINGITERGIYIEINDTKIEGMVALRDIDDDYYIYDEKNYCIYGESTGKRYQLGEQVKVQLIRVNIERKQLDFIFAEE